MTAAPKTLAEWLDGLGTVERDRGNTDAAVALYDTAMSLRNLGDAPMPDARGLKIEPLPDLDVTVIEGTRYANALLRTLGQGGMWRGPFTIESREGGNVTLRSITRWPEAPPPDSTLPPGQFEVGLSEDESEVIVNHQDLQPDGNRCGHIVFSPEQACSFAELVLRKAAACKPRRSGPDHD
jgi:hypothetical protein